MPAYYSVSLGCPKNRVDTEHLLGSLDELRPVEHMEDADFVFINTCGFIQPAVEESVRVIVDAIDQLADCPSRPLLVVGGCLVGRYGVEGLAPDLPEVDLWLPNQALADWPEMLAQALGLPAPTRHSRLLSTGPSYAWLKISDGCRHQCSFCTIPTIRGLHRSTPLPALVEEARSLLDSGVKELVVVAQDVAAWGEDLGIAHGLIHLLDEILPLDGLERLRLMYLYPAGISPELLSFLAQAGPRFMPYFDVPLQHAHPDVLKRMGRPFARDPRLVIDRIRSVFPDAALRTSLIVGFPGESEEHFNDLAGFVRESRFTHLGIFAYQAEEGTPAAQLQPIVPDPVKEWRRDSLMELQAEISAEYLEGIVGQRLPILVDAPHEEWDGLHTGRAWFQAPEVDGITYISGPGVIPGALIEADIVESSDYDLTALT